MNKKENKKIMNEILQDGRIIKEGFTGVYFIVRDEKLLTSIEIHTKAGGDPEVFKNMDRQFMLDTKSFITSMLLII